MKVSFQQVLLSILFCMCGYAHVSYGQIDLDQRISIKVEGTEIKNVLILLEKQANVHFVYSPSAINVSQKVNLIASNEKLSEVLNRLLNPIQISYILKENRIVLKNSLGNFTNPKSQEILNLLISDNFIRGKVTDEKGNPLPNISIAVKNSVNSISTDIDGNYEISLPDGNYVLIFSGMGFKKIEKNIVIKGEALKLDVVMFEDSLQLDQVVVTSSGPRKSKIESSVAITSISAKLIEQRPPLSSMDLLKAIPGLSVESSGGDGPGAVRVRGLPAGSFAYMGVMEDGTALVPTGFITTPSADQFYKVDLTIKNVEALRGGDASMILPSTGGALMNILSNTGGDKFGGKIKYTRGLSQNANRVDFNIGGPLAAKWKYNIGGFYRVDDGVKPANYTANKGGQIKANLTYNFKPQSYLRFYAKVLDDKVAWLVPSYYSYDGSGQGNALPYFDPLTQTLATKDYNVSLTHANGKTYNIDLSDGIHTKLHSLANEFKYVTENDWTIRNNMKYQYSTLSSSTGIVTAPSKFIAGTNYYYLDGTQLNNPTGYYTGQSVTGTKGHFSQFINNLDFNKNIGKHSISFGAAIHTYAANLLSITSATKTELKNNPSIIKVGSTAGNGFGAVSISGYQDGSEIISSGWINYKTNFGNLNIDFGTRVDNFLNKGNRFVNSAPFTNYIAYKDNKSYLTSTLGLNYKLNDYQAIFARGTKTYSALNITDFANFAYNPATVKKRDIYMAEVGYKLNLTKFSLFATLVYAKLQNASALMLVPDKTGNFLNVPSFATSKNLSAEIEAIYNPIPHLTLRWVNTFQKSEYTDFSVTAPAEARADIAGQTYTWNGNSPERIPSVISEISANYSINKWGLFSSYRYIGSRWSSPSNLYKMNGYNEVSAGIDFRATKSIKLRIWGDNLTASRGLTEGNIRGDQFLANNAFATGSPQIGRIILPRSFWASLTYLF